VKVRDRFFNFMLKGLKYKDALMKSTNRPLIRKLGRKLVDPAEVSLTYIPVAEQLEVPSGTPLPASIVEGFIERASHHVILHSCPCRTVNECVDFPRDFGCTFLGEAARDIDPGVGKHVSKEEALDHYRRAREMGLVSVVGKFKGDALALGVKDHRRLMTLCHCCPCCCISTGIHYAAREFRDGIVKLEGLTVEVSDACNGCGSCVEACIFHQMSLVDGKATPGPECKGCGRCATACKRGAIRITVDNPDYIRRCMERISALVDVT
jgi:Fe-S-cluster-containing hydrogenase component 2